MIYAYSYCSSPPPFFSSYNDAITDADVHIYANANMKVQVKGTGDNLMDNDATFNVLPHSTNVVTVPFYVGIIALDVSLNVGVDVSYAL